MAHAIGFELQKSLPNSGLGKIALTELALDGSIQGFSRPEFETSLSSDANWRLQLKRQRNACVRRGATARRSRKVRLLLKHEGKQEKQLP